MNNNKRYIVLGLFKTIQVDGINSKLEDGQWIIPVFETSDEAVKYADGNFEVQEIEIGEQNELL